MQGDAFSGRPAFVKNAGCDKITGYTAAQAITAALLARERGQGGQHVRLSMLDSALSFLWPDGMANQAFLGDDVTLMPPLSMTYQHIETADGFISVAVVTDDQWRGLFRAVDRPELAEDPRFATAEARGKNIAALLEELGGGKTEMTSAEALGRLVAEDVPCGPILSLDEVMGHEQVVACGSIEEHESPVLGRMRAPRPPARCSGTAAELASPAPPAGADTAEVLASLGLAESEITDLRSKGVVS